MCSHSRQHVRVGQFLDEHPVNSFGATTAPPLPDTDKHINKFTQGAIEIAAKSTLHKLFDMLFVVSAVL